MLRDIFKMVYVANVIKKWMRVAECIYRKTPRATCGLRALNKKLSYNSAYFHL